MLPRLPTCSTYSRSRAYRLCGDHGMGFGTGVKHSKESTPVLCVDLDGTLIRGDVLWECVLSVLKTRPLTMLRLPFWWLKGRAFLKQEVAARIQLDPASLPYRRLVLDLLREEKAKGRRVALVT